MLVGGGVVDKTSTGKPVASLIPSGVDWIKECVATFDSTHNTVVLASGEQVPYDSVSVCPGIGLDWDKLEGLKQAVGKNAVCSNYSYDTVDSPWENSRTMTAGKATSPAQ
ncbi:MAG: sulfide:quinone oxidoreductase [Myxococcota bacterium]|jgi:sulfide:quinone oxidoreductase